MINFWKIYSRNPIKSFFKKLKWSKQRIVRGYSDYDVWDIDYWFLQIIPQMLRQLPQNSYPERFNSIEEWKNKLSNLADIFENISKNYYDNYDKEKLKEAFELFIEYFPDLWD